MSSSRDPSPSPPVIRAEGLSKSYHIWREPSARFTGPFLGRLARLPLVLPTAVREGMGRAAAASHREFFALQDVSFEVPRGVSLGIIGRNGAGKSTLLQIITGTLTPTTGRVEVRGRAAALLELGSGFNPEFTGRENVRLNAALYGLTPAEINGRLEAILAFADIGDFVDQPVKTYSSGMMLRLAFAVIAHLDADVLIIDEALAVGDVFFVQKCMSYLRGFQDQGGVLLFVSHEPSILTSLCQQALWLDGGRLRLQGTPKAVTEAYLEAFHLDQAAAKRGGATAKTTPVADAALPIGRRNAGGDAAPRGDQRRLYPHLGALRNDIQVFEFDPKKSGAYGVGGGRVLDVTLADETGTSLAWLVGNEIVSLRVRCEALEPLERPIIGFYVKNIHGQELFGDNTFAFTEARGAAEDGTLRTETGEVVEARFVFQMPVLPPGDYMIAVALADGTQLEHIIHHWIHDALAIRSVSSPLRAGGLVGLPMLEVAIEKSALPVPAAAA